MTFPQLPTNVELGNAGLDISSAVNSFAKGLQEERAKRREEAMSQALMQLKMQEFLHPRPISQLVQGPNGPETHLLDPRNLSVLQSAPAPNRMTYLQSQDENGTPGYVGQPVFASQTPQAQPQQQPTDYGATQGYNNPQQTQVPQMPQATSVHMPPGIQGRAEPDIPVQTQTPSGTVTDLVNRRHGTARPVSSGAGTGVGLATRATDAEDQRARAAFEMVQGKYEMNQALASAGQQAPQAYDEAARYISSLEITGAIPLVGNFIEEIINQGQAAGLSDAAARYYSAFMHAAAARAFAQGGKTLTKNEIDYALRSLSPKPMEDPQTSAMRERLWHGIIGGAVAGNNAWMKYRNHAKLLGYDDSDLGIVEPPPVTSNVNRFTGRPRH